MLLLQLPETLLFYPTPFRHPFTRRFFFFFFLDTQQTMNYTRNETSQQHDYILSLATTMGVCHLPLFTSHFDVCGARLLQLPLRPVHPSYYCWFYHLFNDLMKDPLQKAIALCFCQRSLEEWLWSSG